MYNKGEIFQVTGKIKRVLHEEKGTFRKLFTGTIIKQKILSGDADSHLKKEETFIAESPFLTIGDEFSAKGQIIMNKSFGFMIIASDFQIDIPSDEIEYKNYLKRNLKGVGTKTVELMYDIYKSDIIDGMPKSPQKIISAGLNEAKAKAIIDQLLPLSSYSTFLSYMTAFDVPVSDINLIHNKFRHESLSIVQNDTYRILSIDGLGFRTADTIAHTLKKTTGNDVNRLIYGTLYFLKDREISKGDIGYPLDKLLKQLPSWLSKNGGFSLEENKDISSKNISEAIKRGAKLQILSTDTVDDATLVYQKELLNAENSIVRSVSGMLTQFRPPITSKEEIEKFLVKYQNGDYLDEEAKRLKIKPFAPAREQKDIVRLALTKNLTILTGGPGTGKTAAVNLVVEAYKRLNRTGGSICLVAPTGRAAKRLSTLTNHPAMTVHRRLKMGGYGTGELETIEEDLLIIDEFSMVDAELTSVILNNISPTTHVLMVGDVDQLPSIGAGLILRDLIDSEVVPVIKLTKIFRQAENSQIVSNAFKLIHGRKDLTFDKRKNDMYLIRQNDVQKTREMVVDSFMRFITHYQFSIHDIVILTPMRKGELGMDELNRILQQKYNPQSDSKAQVVINDLSGDCFRVGDKVIQLVNDNDKVIMNGETGIITDIYSSLQETSNGNLSSKETIDVTFIEGDEERIVTYFANEFGQLTLAYAMSIHKSQGSEFPCVIIPFAMEQRNMLQRNLLYTALTRASKTCVFIGQPKAISFGIDNIQNLSRYSLLISKLRKAMQGAELNKAA